MINSHLRVSTITNPLAQLPGMVVNTFGLVERDLLEIMSKNLNFSALHFLHDSRRYELCVPSDIQALGFPQSNGTWTGLIGQLMRGEADMSFLLASKTLTRSQVVDQTLFPVLTDNLAIMIPYPEIERGISFSISISSTIAVTSFFAATIVVAVLIWLFHRFLKNDAKFRVGELIMLLAAVTLNQGVGYLRFKSTAFRLTYGTWLLALFVLLNIYSGMLTSMLSTPSHKFLAYSIEDVVANENIKTLVVKGSPGYGDVTASLLPNLQKISMRLQQNPNFLVKDSDYVESLLSAPNQVFILSDIVQNRAIGSDFKKKGYCRALTLEKFIQSRNNNFVLPKKSPYTAIFDRKSLFLAQSGLVHYFEKRSYTSSYLACSVRELKSKESQAASLKMNQFWTVFLILIIGSFMSFVLFLGEILFFTYQRRPRRVFLTY